MSTSNISPPAIGRKLVSADPRRALRPLIADSVAHIDHVRLHCAEFPPELDTIRKGIRQLPQHNAIRMTCPDGSFMDRDNVAWLAALQRRSLLGTVPTERMTTNYLEVAVEAGTKNQRDADLIVSQFIRQRVTLRYPPQEAYKQPVRLARFQMFKGEPVWTNGAYWCPEDADKNLVVYSTKPKHFEYGCRVEVRLRGEVLRKLVATLDDVLVLNPRMLFRQVVHVGHLGLLPLIPTALSWS